MHLLRILLALGLAGSSVASSNIPRLRTRDNAPPSAVADAIVNQYIIEFAEESKNVDYNKMIAEISARANTTILKQFNSKVFRGVSVEAISDTAESLQVSPKIVKAWQSHMIPLLETFKGNLTIPPNGIDPANYSVHAMTGVDQLHNRGIYGKGAVVGIIDSGTNYYHPALGGGFGPGFRVEGGHDFAGESIYPAPLEPDDDPLDSNGHGTHVAGILGGNADWFKGVAPEVTIRSYKVFGGGANPQADDATIIEAFLMAYEDGVDIITASVGGYLNWSNNPWAVVADRLVDEGVIVTIAAGNYGGYGPLFGSNGSNGDNVLAIASVEASQIFSIPFVATLENDGETVTHSMGYRPNQIAPFAETLTNVPVYAISLNTSVLNDACLPLPEDTPDLTGHVVLIRQTDYHVCFDYQQIENIFPTNALGVMWYRQLGIPEAWVDPVAWFDRPDFFTGVISPEAGELIVETLAAGGNVSFDFSEFNRYVTFPVEWGGYANDFTSWGGTVDLKLKPDIAAPGGDITSTWLGEDYLTLSGTSMATPYVAGVAALYVGEHGGRSVHGKDFAKMLHARIMSSGASMPWPYDTTDGGKYLASPSQVGNGLLNALKVLDFDTQLSFTKFALNDTLHFSRYQKVNITNNSDKEITYTFGVEDAGGYDIMDDNYYGGETVVELYYLQMYSLKTEVAFPSGTFKVKPGQTKQAQFTFKLPQLGDHPSKRMPVYSGKIMIYGSNGEQLSVPYYGVLADVKKEVRTQGVFWDGYGYPIIQFPSGETIDEKPYWNFSTSTTTPDWPLLNVATIWGTAELRWDIFTANWPERKWDWPLVEGENGYVGSATYWSGGPESQWFDITKDDPSDVIAFPALQIDRQQLYSYIWLGQLTNGSTIAPGKYTMRIATLLPFGNHASSDNWDIMKTPQITITAQ